MFTVIESTRYKWHSGGRRETVQTWVVWCGWQNQPSAEFYDFEEACRNAALKEWFYEHSLWR